MVPRGSGAKGYSMVELLVAVALLGIMGYLGARLWVTSTKASKSTQQRMSIRTELGVAVSRVRQAVLTTVDEIDTPVSSSIGNNFIDLDPQANNITYRLGFEREDGSFYIQAAVSNQCVTMPPNLVGRVPTFNAQYFRNGDAIKEGASVLEVDSDALAWCRARLREGNFGCSEGETVMVKIETYDGSRQLTIPRGIERPNWRYNPTLHPFAAYACFYRPNTPSSTLIVFAAAYDWNVPKGSGDDLKQRRTKWLRMKAVFPPAGSGFADYFEPF